MALIIFVNEAAITYEEYVSILSSPNPLINEEVFESQKQPSDERTFEEWFNNLSLTATRYANDYSENAFVGFGGLPSQGWEKENWKLSQIQLAIAHQIEYFVVESSYGERRFLNAIDNGSVNIAPILANYQGFKEQLATRVNYLIDSTGIRSDYISGIDPIETDPSAYYPIVALDDPTKNEASTFTSRSIYNGEIAEFEDSDLNEIILALYQESGTIFDSEVINTSILPELVTYSDQKNINEFVVPRLINLNTSQVLNENVSIVGSNQDQINLNVQNELDILNQINVGNIVGQAELLADVVLLEGDTDIPILAVTIDTTTTEEVDFTIQLPFSMVRLIGATNLTITTQLTITSDQQGILLDILVEVSPGSSPGYFSLKIPTGVTAGEVITYSRSLGTEGGNWTWTFNAVSGVSGIRATEIVPLTDVLDLIAKNANGIAELESGYDSTNAGNAGSLAKYEFDSNGTAEIRDTSGNIAMQFNTDTINVASRQIINVAPPTNNDDVTNKLYVDNAIANINVPGALVYGSKINLFAGNHNFSDLDGLTRTWPTEYAPYFTSAYTWKFSFSGESNFLNRGGDVVPISGDRLAVIANTVTMSYMASPTLRNTLSVEATSTGFVTYVTVNTDSSLSLSTLVIDIYDSNLVVAPPSSPTLNKKGVK